MPKARPWGSQRELEVKRRIVLAVAAYAYELESDPIMSDALFDKMALEVQPHLKTGRPTLDAFFASEFSPHTGQWIHKHPHPNKLKRLYRDYYRGRMLG